METKYDFSVALSKGCNLEWVAEYCGTSVEQIEKGNGKFIADDGAAPLIRSLGEAKTQTHPQIFAVPASNYRERKVVPGGIEPPEPSSDRPPRRSRRLATLVAA